MARSAMGSGHVPSSPTQVERAAMVGRVCRGRRGHPAALGIDAAHEEARDIHRRIRRVAQDTADVIPTDARRVRRLIQGVEDRPLPRILCREFEDITASYPTDGYGIVEEDRPGVGWA